MSNRKNHRSLPVQYLTRISILTALAAVLFLTLEIPVVAFYKLDFSAVPVLLGAFSMGPGPALIILALKEVIHLLLKGLGTTLGIGDLADFIMTAAFILPAGLLYRRHKTRKQAILGMALGTLCTIVVAVLTNWLLLFPTYMAAYHMDLQGIIGMASKALPFVDTEWKLLLFVTAPFNLLKGCVISLITALIYKPLSPLLKVQAR